MTDFKSALELYRKLKFDQIHVQNFQHELKFLDEKSLSERSIVSLCATEEEKKQFDAARIEKESEIKITKLKHLSVLDERVHSPSEPLNIRKELLIQLVDFCNRLITEYAATDKELAPFLLEHIVNSISQSLE